MQGREWDGWREGGTDGRREGRGAWLLHTELMHKWRESLGDSGERVGRVVEGVQRGVSKIFCESWELIT